MGGKAEAVWPPPIRKFCCLASFALESTFASTKDSTTIATPATKSPVNASQAASDANFAADTWSKADSHPFDQQAEASSK